MSNTIRKLATEIGILIGPVGDFLSDFEQFESLLLGLGWQVRNLAEVPDEFESVKEAVGEVEASITALIQSDQATPSQIETALERLRACTDLIRRIDTSQFVTNDLIDAGFQDIFPRQLLDFLVIEHLQANYPKLLNVLGIVGIVRIRQIDADGLRPAFVSREFLIEDLPRLLDDATPLLLRAFESHELELHGSSLLDFVEDLFLHAGISTQSAYVPSEIVSVLTSRTEDDVPPIRSLRIIFFEQLAEDDVVSAGLELIPFRSTSEEESGLAILPFLVGETESGVAVNESMSFEVQGTLDARAGVALLLQTAGSVSILTDLLSSATDSTSGDFTFRLKYQDESEDASTLLAVSNDTRFEYRGLSVALGALHRSGTSRAFVEAELIDARLVVGTAQTDGFLEALLPPGGLDLQFGFGIGASSDTGFYFSGASGLRTQVPLHARVGPAKFKSVSVGLRNDRDAVELSIATTIDVEIGPIAVSVDSVGIKTRIDGSTDKGNLGFVDATIDFKPPNGVGLSVDGGGFKGGGFLRYEPEDERYIGMLELEFKDSIALKAIGILTTKLPGTEDGYSLLIVITSEFEPIQLGYGFTLNGVGGLLGLNRSVSIDRLRLGVRDKTLDSVLFPQNIVANANRIISDMRQVFPPSEGRFVFGPMAKIGWGAPTLITIDLGLAIEVPEPISIAILGVLKAVLPDDKKRLLQLRVNFLGVIDFQKEQISFDASLYDSKLLAFTLTGDMALRLNWGDNPNFLLTVGGFHPAYEPPPMSLPTLRRLTVQLLAGKNPRITLETYFAITSNTTQLGAKAELYAAAGPFNVYGILAFDALFQFSPFYFIADTTAMLALRRKSKSIASIRLDLTLEGTTPWKAKGTAKLKICWFLTVKIRFNKTFGRSDDTRLDDLSVLTMLERELSNDGNWRAALPPRRQLLVSVRETDRVDDRVVVHPFGALTIKQKVVPLNVHVDRVGYQRPRDGNKFAINSIMFGDHTQNSEPSKESFAPAQFFDMSDEEKLTSKSFEQYDGGIRITGTDELRSSHVVRREVRYKLSYIDSQRNMLRKPALVAPYASAFNAWSDGGAVSASPLSESAGGKTALAPPAVSVANEKYVLVGTDDMQPIDSESMAVGEAEVKARMNELTTAKPALLGKLQAVPAHELL